VEGRKGERTEKGKEDRGLSPRYAGHARIKNGRRRGGRGEEPREEIVVEDEVEERKRGWDGRWDKQELGGRSWGWKEVEGRSKGGGEEGGVKGEERERE